MQNFKKMRRRLFWIAVSLLIFILHVSAQKDWTLQKEEDGIKVYTKKESVSNYKAFKAEMQVSCTIKDIIGVLKDADAFCKCITYSKEVKVLQMEDDDVYYYVETSLPWPFDNRDMVYHLEFSEMNSEPVKVMVTGLPEYIPPREGVVRIAKANGYWLLVSIDARITNVTYQMQVEPGGSIPAWLANLSIVNIPHSTFRNLKNMLYRSKPPEK
jgi:carbon monoxide dehydrogenase subunit G